MVHTVKYKLIKSIIMFVLTQTGLLNFFMPVADIPPAQVEQVQTSVMETEPEFHDETKVEVMEEEVEDEATDDVELSHAHFYGEIVVTEPTCTERGYTTYTCECGESYEADIVKQLGHSYTWENAIVVEPTPHEQGYTRYRCERCESAYDTNYVDYLSTIIFYDVNETVWANTAVNVRQGPSTEYDIVGGLEWAETVTRIAIGDNGWSKIRYNGQDAYVYTDYVQTAKPSPPFDGSVASEEVASSLRNSGATGVLYIPSVGMEPVNVYLYYGAHVRSLQSLADRHNSAYLVGVYDPNHPGVHKIEFGDHVNHNFSVLKSIPVGTMAYFNMGNKVVRFKCVETIGYLSMSQYKAGIVYEDGMIVTTCCSGNGRTVNRWVVTSDSDLTFDEFYQIVSQGEVVYWN